MGLQDGWYEHDDVYMREITVPFPPESPASGIGDPSFHPVVWYRRNFEVAPEDAGKRLNLHCGAVDYRAQVWVNGQLVASHEGGQTPFGADITHALKRGVEQVIVIRAEDRPTDLSQPRGKQDWAEHPHRVWYHRTTGIWQPVWLEPVAPIHITDLRWTPDLDRGTLGMAVSLSRQDPATEGHPPVRVHVQLSLHGVSLVDDLCVVQGQDLQREFSLDLGEVMMSRERVLWSPDHPNLIDATVTVLVGDEVVDEVQSYAGLRSVDTRGGRFLLNGLPYYLRFALEQGYWPESHLAAPSDQALRHEVELAKELGFNGVRIHQKVEDPRFLYWCDRLGLMVWGEMANAYVFSGVSMERLTREWLEVLARDSSHPCIGAWVPFNESWGVPNLMGDPAQQPTFGPKVGRFVEAIYLLTKAHDPTRPVVANDGWEYLCGDILGIHDYAPTLGPKVGFSGEVIRERYGSGEAIERTLREVQVGGHFLMLANRRDEGVPIMLTEFGGISFRPEPDFTNWFGYGTVASDDAFYQKYRELVQAVLDCPSIAGFCYTQLADTAQETNGLLTEHREPKLDPTAIAAITRRPL